ncbi:MAG: PAS domain S-box protein [Desulfobacterales bacterium]|nr:PAS domain S-box protein [Desulfobacterales bacterium]
MKNTYPMNAAVVGCGERCRRFLEYLLDARLQWLPINLVGLACPEPTDRACELARKNGIYRTSDYRDLYEMENLHLLINLMDPQVPGIDLAGTKPSHLRLIDGDLADLFREFFHRARQWDDRLLEIKQWFSKSEHKFRSLVENSLTGIYINLDGRIVFANKRFADIFGYTPEKILGVHYLELVHPEDHKKVREIHRKRLNREAAPQEYESRGLTRDGSTVWLNRRNTRIEYEGRPAILGNMVDITEQKQVTDKLMQMEKLASLGTLTAGVAHELNNPLNNISGSLEIVLEEWEDGDDAFKKNLLQDMAHQVERGQEIIRGLLDFSRGEALDVKSVDFYDLAARAIGRVREQIPQNVRVEFDIAESEQAKLSYYHIQRVLINLVVNALQAMGEQGGCLRIAAWHVPEENRFCFSVADTGKGIEQADLKRIFDPFYTTKEPSKGTGMGLSITHGIVRQHSGRIDVHSQPGAGTTFTVCLPEY